MKKKITTLLRKAKELKTKVLTILLYGDGSVKETNNKDYSEETLREQWDVEETPFTIVRNEAEYMVVMGKFRISDTFKTKKEAVEYAKDKSWERILQVMSVMIEAYPNLKEITARLEGIEATLKQEVK